MNKTRRRKQKARRQSANIDRDLRATWTDKWLDRFAPPLMFVKGFEPPTYDKGRTISLMETVREEPKS